MFGLFNVKKPAGPTSHDMVARLRRKLDRKVKVGHAGTLDPFAEGVLVLCAGPATRLAQYVQAQAKRYRAEITLGSTSSTDDSEGLMTSCPPAAIAGKDEMRRILAEFVGTIQQTPPAYSAVHVNGRRAYKLARAGRRPDLSPRSVTVHEIGLLHYDWPVLEIEVRCAAGTYIRALARDIGAALGTGGYCSRLTRTEVGIFHLERAVSVEELDPARDLISPLLALGALPQVAVEPADRSRVLNGRSVPLKAVALPARVDEVALIDRAGRLLALAAIDRGQGIAKPTRVFPEP